MTVARSSLHKVSVNVGALLPFASEVQMPLTFSDLQAALRLELYQCLKGVNLLRAVGLLSRTDERGAPKYLITDLGRQVLQLAGSRVRLAVPASLNALERKVGSSLSIVFSLDIEGDQCVLIRATCVARQGRKDESLIACVRRWVQEAALPPLHLTVVA